MRLKTLHKHTLCGRFILYLLFVSLSVNSQVKYPTDSSFINILSNSDKDNFKIFSISKIDTSITNFQNYFPRNTNGHLGLSSAPLLIDYKSKALGFNFYTLPYQNDGRTVIEQ